MNSVIAQRLEALREVMQREHLAAFIFASGFDLSAGGHAPRVTINN